MRKLKLFSLLAVLLCAASVNVVFAQTTINHVNYEFDEDAKTATVVGADYTWENSDVSLVIPAQVEYNSQNYAVTAIGDDAFQGAEYLVSIELPEGLLSIGNAAFNQTRNLASINIPNSVTSVGEEAFAEAFKEDYPSGVNAIDIVLGNGLTELSRWMFSYASMKSVTLQEGLLEIKQGAFQGCGYLTSITIPSTVTHIWGDGVAEGGEGDAFEFCNELTDIYCYADPANLTWDDTNSDDFIASPAKTTRCHVKSCELDAFQAKFAHVNVTFVGDLPCATTPTPAVNGKLPGAFSVSADKQVYFSQGNLQYTKSTGKFSFMNNQYDMVETPDQNVDDDYADQDVVSLFGWGTSGWDNTSVDATSVHYQPYATCNINHGTDNNRYQYGPSNANVVGDEFEFATAESWLKSDDYKNYDWGVYNSGDLGADWRTLTALEWKYLFSDRTDASNLRALATVNGVKGVILMPDGWTAGDVSLTITMYSYDTNIINTDNWETLEGQGCVFLPAARCRRGNTIDNSIYSGCYWSSTSCSASAAYYVYFEADYLDAPTKSSRWLGYSVRLVSETAPASTPDPTPATPETSDNVDGIETAMEALVTAGGTTDLTINRTLYKDGFFNTICLPFSLTEAELDASPLAGCLLYSLSDASYDGYKLDLTIAEESTIEAGMPYLIKWNYGENITSMTFNDVTVTASTGSTVTKGSVRFVGTIGRSTLPHGVADYLFLGANDNLYYSDGADDTSMKGFRAYFIVNSDASGDVPRHAPARLVIAPKMPTAVENVQGDNVQSTKVIENGQLYLMYKGTKYNVQGKVVK